MSEWQPAITINIHGFSNPRGIPSPAKTEIRKTSEELSKFLLDERREYGCDPETTQFYVTREGDKVCEHEILTD